MRCTEVIKIQEGKFCNLEAHAQRIFDTAMHFSGRAIDLGPLTKASIAPHLCHGVVKCRVVYSDSILAIDFEPYTYRNIKTLALVESDTIEYGYKLEDRSPLTELYAQRGEADEVLIVQNGAITDTSFSNVVLRSHDGGLYTPETYLLAGTKRALLLKSGVIRQRPITVGELHQYSGIYLINAMLDLEDQVSPTLLYTGMN